MAHRMGRTADRFYSCHLSQSHRRSAQSSDDRTPVSNMKYSYMPIVGVDCPAADLLGHALISPATSRLSMAVAAISEKGAEFIQTTADHLFIAQKPEEFIENVATGVNSTVGVLADFAVEEPSARKTGDVFGCDFGGGKCRTRRFFHVTLPFLFGGCDDDTTRLYFQS
jgi:hypothetical protein